DRTTAAVSTANASHHAREATSTPPTTEVYAGRDRGDGPDGDGDEGSVQRRHSGDLRTRHRHTAWSEVRQLEREHIGRGDRDRVLRGGEQDDGRATRAAAGLGPEAQRDAPVRLDGHVRQRGPGQRLSDLPEAGGPADRRELVCVREDDLHDLAVVPAVRHLDRVVQESSVEGGARGIEGGGRGTHAFDGHVHGQVA